MSYIKFLEERYRNLCEQCLEQERRVDSLLLELLKNAFADNAKFRQLEATTRQEIKKYADLVDELEMVKSELGTIKVFFAQPQPDFSLN